MTPLRSGIIAGLVACVVLVTGFWFLNNTNTGLRIKCNVLNDVGACLLYALSHPSGSSPSQPTEDPSVVEEQRAQQEATNALDKASSDLQYAVNSLATAATAASDEAGALDDAVEQVRAAVGAEQTVFDELGEMINAGSTGEFWVNDVSFKLYDVQFARDSVDFARDEFEFATYSIQGARDSRGELAGAVDAAVVAFESAISRYPDGAPGPYSIDQAQTDSGAWLAEIDRAVAAYQEAVTQADALMADADDILEQATSLAASVGAE